ncbi:MAG: FAD-dependent monooxygenase, partial [Bosea sp. (in: a-proteobacteria)]
HKDFVLEWVSVYRFQCRRLERFIHDRVIFAGDSAHQVSPFGARGANSGVQDADNLGWKLALAIKGQAGPNLIPSYDFERGQAADENILNSTRSTDFLAPPSAAEKVMRDAVLTLATKTGFAKRMVNSGRLSLPTAYAGSPLSTPDAEPWEAGVAPGAPMLDAPLGDGGWLTRLAATGRPVLLFKGSDLPEGLPKGIDALPVSDAAHADKEGHLRRRYDLQAGDACLLRPDGHVAARFRQVNAPMVTDALRRMEGFA